MISRVQFHRRAPIVPTALNEPAMT